MLKINRFRLWILAFALALVSVASLGGLVAASASSATFPKIIPVPNGFYPEALPLVVVQISMLALSLTGQSTVETSAQVKAQY
jgi:hypothetical protein